MALSLAAPGADVAGTTPAYDLAAFLDASRDTPLEREQPKRYLRDHALRLHAVYEAAAARLPAGAAVLSVGPGRAFVEIALVRTRAARVTALDFAEMLALYVRQYAAFGIEPVAGDFVADEDALPAGAFDGALFCEVLEHIPLPPAEQFRRLARHLRPGGVLFMTTPNVARVENVLALAAGHNVVTSAEALFAPVAATHQHVHRREYVMHEVVTALADAGFRPLFARHVRQSPKASFRGVLRERVLCGLVPRWRPVLFVAARLEKTG